MKRNSVGNWVLLILVLLCCFFPLGCSPAEAAPTAQPEPAAVLAKELPATQLVSNGYPVPNPKVGVTEKRYPPQVRELIRVEALANSLTEQARQLEQQGLPGVAETKQAARSMEKARQQSWSRLTPEEQQLYRDYRRIYGG